MKNSLEENLKSAFKKPQIAAIEKDRLVIAARKEEVLDILRFLKAKGYDHLGLVSCVDWIEENEFELVYILSSYMQDDDRYTEKEKTNIVVKARIPRDKPHFFTAIPIFPISEPYERELHELYGIDFEGHPRQIPLFLERDYTIPPFRKDFDTRKYVKDVFDKIPFIEDEKK